MTFTARTGLFGAHLLDPRGLLRVAVGALELGTCVPTVMVGDRGERRRAA